ncbi:MAG: endonuclease/exonuclease/phosphatase family protein [Planctomycetota bacterium]|nr:endonuclease/exonuclease/phosphatase family protein [Planctomycetota bacterium]
MYFRCLVPFLLAVLGVIAPGISEAFSADGPTTSGETSASSPASNSIRVATFNVSLYRKKAGQLAFDLERGDAQAEQLAKIIRQVNPDIVLLNEIDDDGGKDNGKSVRLFRDKYLHRQDSESVSSPPLKPWDYYYSPSVNTGVDSGLDLDNNGKTGSPADCWGYGEYPGQYGLAVLSRYPIDAKKIRTFQKFLWKDMPNALRPTNADGSSYWNDSIWSQLRLTSKTHADIPITIHNQTLHLLVSHPTPPVFDGPEDRNGRRNNDEIRLFKDYVEWSATNSTEPSYHYDDSGIKGALAKDACFIILGDLNADPIDGNGLHDGIQGLLDSKQVNGKIVPTSEGGVEAASLQGKQNAKHKGNSAYDTGDFNDANPGNLRCDFALPSANIEVASSGVFWPKREGISSDDKKMIEATDHRLVWVDLLLPNN